VCDFRREFQLELRNLPYMSFESVNQDQIRILSSYLQLRLYTAVTAGGVFKFPSRPLQFTRTVFPLRGRV